MHRSWRLNSNHYGALQGRSKAEVRAEAGDEQFMRWRRGYRERPPLGEPDDDPRYAVLPPDARPRGESLHDVMIRLLPYWCDAIVPDLFRHRCVLVVSHGNTLRALVKHLESLSDDAVADLEIPNATPLRYRAGLLTHAGGGVMNSARFIPLKDLLSLRCGGRADDADRAGRVVQQGGGGRAEGRAGDFAPAAGAHDDHLGFGAGVKQRRSRRALADLPQHGDAGMLFLPAG